MKDAADKKVGPSLRELIAKGELERAKEIYSVTDENIRFIRDRMSPAEQSHYLSR